jgi:hypothetical protein
MAGMACPDPEEIRHTGDDGGAHHQCGCDNCMMAARLMEEDLAELQAELEARSAPRKALAGLLRDRADFEHRYAS